MIRRENLAEYEIGGGFLFVGVQEGLEEIVLRQAKGWRSLHGLRDCRVTSRCHHEESS